MPVQPLGRDRVSHKLQFIIMEYQMSSYLTMKLRQNMDMKNYLKELEALVGREVRRNDLCSFEKTTALREHSARLAIETPASWEIPFSEKHGDRFGQFLKKLTAANPSPVYLWLEKSTYCGVLLIDTLQDIRQDFGFNIDDNGIISLFTEDLCDELLLDLWLDDAENEWLTIEVKGKNWRNISY